MLWALNDAPTENPTDAFVLVALADNAWDDGRGAFPAIATIAKRARVSERTVQRSLRTLEADGLIRQGDQALAASYGRYAPTVYELAISAADGRFPAETPPASPQVSRGDNLSPLPRGDVRGDTDDRLGVTPVSPEPRPLTGEPRSSVRGGSHQRAREAEKPHPEDPPNYDEHGPLTPRCDRHLTATDDPPCWDCAATRPEFEAAQIRRTAAQDRARSAAAREARARHEATAAAAPESIELARAAAKAAANKGHSTATVSEELARKTASQQARVRANEARPDTQDPGGDFVRSGGLRA